MILGAVPGRKSFFLNAKSASGLLKAQGSEVERQGHRRAHSRMVVTGRRAWTPFSKRTCLPQEIRRT